MAKKLSRRRRTSVSELLGHAATPWQPMRKAMAAVVVLVWSLAAWQLHVHAPAAADNAYVVDDAGVVSPAAGAKLAAALDRLKRQTGVQVLVETVPDLHGQSIEAYAVDEFQRRRLGRKGVDDGVLFVLAPNQRRARIEVGYGLEGVLTDVTTSLILRHRVVPAMRNGDADRALLQGAEGIWWPCMAPGTLPDRRSGCSSPLRRMVSGSGSAPFRRCSCWSSSSCLH
jgi:uncharacterized protein